MNICFTGHRPEHLTAEQCGLIIDWLRMYIEKMIVTFKNVNFISGAARGVDLWAAEIVLEMKEKYKNNDIKLTMAVPHKGHGIGKSWTDGWAERHNIVLSKADHVVFTHKGTYNWKCMQDRNEWMVDRSNIVIAVWTGKLGGTRNCYVYAAEEKKPIIRFNPLTNETTKIKQ